MKTVTISMRLPESEADHLEQVARDLNMQRPALLKRALKRGTDDLLFEHACQAYRRGEVTLSRAAEMAGIGLARMIAKLQDADLELNYDVTDLARDLMP